MCCIFVISTDYSKDVSTAINQSPYSFLPGTFPRNLTLLFQLSGFQLPSSLACILVSHFFHAFFLQVSFASLGQGSSQCEGYISVLNPDLRVRSNRKVHNRAVLLDLTSGSQFTTDNFVHHTNSVDIPSSFMINMLSLKYEDALSGCHLTVSSVSDSQRQGCILGNNTSCTE